MVGGSIALVQDGRIIAHHEYGYADQAGGRKVDPGTLFHWASNTKTLNAISIMQLRDRGLLRLQDPVTRYVPELRQVHNPFGSMAYGSFVKVLEDYVGPPPKMTLEQAVYKMSGLTAHVVGIHDRGELVRGKKADILVFSLADLHSRASWVEPMLRPSGLASVPVNGKVAFEQANAERRELHGRMLKRENSRQRS
jgi:N-acyl-D-aspartate/D-glutamate deacylase